MPYQKKLTCNCETCLDINNFEKKIDDFLKMYPITYYEVGNKVCPKCGKRFCSARIYHRHIRKHCIQMQRILGGKFTITLKKL